MTAPPTIPFEATAHVRDACLCLHTQRAARVLARRFDEALRPAGLTNGQFSLLMALNRPAPAAMREVADLLGADGGRPRLSGAGPAHLDANPRGVGVGAGRRRSGAAAARPERAVEDRRGR